MQTGHWLGVDAGGVLWMASGSMSVLPDNGGTPQGMPSPHLRKTCVLPRALGHWLAAPMGRKPCPITVVLLTYVVMPFLTRRFRGWLLHG